MQSPAYLIGHFIESGRICVDIPNVYFKNKNLTLKVVCRLRQGERHIRIIGVLLVLLLEIDRSDRGQFLVNKLEKVDHFVSFDLITLSYAAEYTLTIAS